MLIFFVAVECVSYVLLHHMASNCFAFVQFVQILFRQLLFLHNLQLARRYDVIMI